MSIDMSKKPRHVYRHNTVSMDASHMSIDISISNVPMCWPRSYATIQCHDPMPRSNAMIPCYDPTLRGRACRQRRSCSRASLASSRAFDSCHTRRGRSIHHQHTCDRYWMRRGMFASASGSQLVADDASCAPHSLWSWSRRGL